MKDDRDPESASGAVPPFLVRLHAEQTSPRDLLRDLVHRLDSTPQPDPELCRDVGSGDLESLLMVHEEELWPDVEQTARSNPRFRRALSSVWAYDSPKFNQRSALLEELGEYREVMIRFTVAPEDFGPDPPLSWRALDAPGDVSGHRLAAILRLIADHLDQPPAG